MEERRVGCDRCFAIVGARQLFVFHVDCRRRRLGDLTRIGGHRRNVFADEAHLLVGEHRPILEGAADEAFADIGAGHHGVHAGHREGRAGIDLDDPGVRYGRGHEGRPQHALAGVIGRIFCLAGNFFATVDAGFVLRQEVVARRDRGGDGGGRHGRAIILRRPPVTLFGRPAPPGRDCRFGRCAA
jgi:hypothetical protein